MKLITAMIQPHVEHWHDWMGFFGICPKCDADFERDRPNQRPDGVPFRKPERYQFVANDTGKEGGDFFPHIYVALVEIECPYCFEWCWAHVTKDTVESIEEKWGRPE